MIAMAEVVGDVERPAGGPRIDHRTYATASIPPAVPLQRCTGETARTQAGDPCPKADDLLECILLECIRISNTVDRYPRSHSE